MIHKRVSRFSLTPHALLLTPFIVGALLCLGIDARAAELITLRYGQNAASAGSLSSLPLTVAEIGRAHV